MRESEGRKKIDGMVKHLTEHTRMNERQAREFATKEAYKADRREKGKR